ncbi:hypothetical protein D3C87_1865780 [compost metagenome]
MLRLAWLRQSITASAQQLRRATEEATVVENLPERFVGPVHAAVLQLTSTQITLLHFVLGQQHLAPKARLFQ